MKYAYPLAWRWSPEFFVGRKPVIDIGRAPTPFYSDVSRPVRVRLRFTQTGATRCDSNYFDVDDECNARRMQRVPAVRATARSRTRLPVLASGPAI